jgi:hypothetical protein
VYVADVHTGVDRFTRHGVSVVKSKSEARLDSNSRQIADAFESGGLSP